MFDKVFDSFKDHFSQRARNPLLATILIVWTFKNWRLIYGLFTFDDKATQATKLTYIENYFNDYSFYKTLWESVFYSFIVLIITYILLGTSRFIVDSYENIILPRIKKLTNPKSIVTKETFDEVVKNMETIEVKFYQEREAKIKAQNERESFEQRNGELIIESQKSSELSFKNKSLEDKVRELEDSLKDYSGLIEENENLKNQINDNHNLLSKVEKADQDLNMLNKKYQRLQGDNQKIIEEYNSLVSEKANPSNKKKEKILNELRANDLIKNYLKLGKLILNEESMEKSDETIQAFTGLELIRPSSHHINEFYYYSFTDIGKEIYDFLRYDY